MLKELGKKFVELNGVHYMHLDGVIVIKQSKGKVLRVRVLPSTPLSPSDRFSPKPGSW
jgi:hypothetical protein